MLRAISRILVVSLFMAWFFLFRPTFLGGPASYIMVAGSSMEPTFYTGDLVITHKQDVYRPGDVAAYRTPSGNIIHRIVEQRDDGRFVLLGDNKKATDPTFPSSEEIVGKQFLLIPNGGDAIAFMREPLPFAALLGGMMLMTLSKRKRLSQFVQRRLRARRRRTSAGFGMPAPMDQSRAMTLFSTSLAVTLVFALALFYALRQPTTSASGEGEPLYTQIVSFPFEIAVVPSSLYSGTTISSDDIDFSGTDEFSTSQPIFTQLAKDIDLGIEYEMISQADSDIAGEIGVSMEVAAIGGWTKRLELQSVTPFSGTSADSQVSITLSELQDLISQIEEETGYRPNSYTIAVLPTISVHGSVDGVPVDSTFTPSYEFELTSTQLIPKSDLVQTRGESVRTAPVQSNEVTLAGMDVGVQPLRVLGGTATMIGILVTAAIAATVFLGLGRGEVAKVQARFKTVFVEATGLSAPQPMSVVDVASLQDLARLAQRDGGIVFHQNVDENGRRFFVPDGTTMYQFVAEHSQTGG